MREGVSRLAQSPKCPSWQRLVQLKDEMESYPYELRYRLFMAVEKQMYAL